MALMGAFTHSIGGGSGGGCGLFLAFWAFCPPLLGANSWHDNCKREW